MNCLRIFLGRKNFSFEFQPIPKPHCGSKTPTRPKIPRIILCPKGFLAGFLGVKEKADYPNHLPDLVLPHLIPLHQLINSLKSAVLLKYYK